MSQASRGSRPYVDQNVQQRRLNLNVTAMPLRYLNRIAFYIPLQYYDVALFKYSINWLSLWWLCLEDCSGRKMLPEAKFSNIRVHVIFRASQSLCFLKMLFDFRRSDASNQWHYYLFGQVLPHIVLYFLGYRSIVQCMFRKSICFWSICINLPFLFFVPPFASVSVIEFNTPVVRQLLICF